MAPPKAGPIAPWWHTVLIVGFFLTAPIFLGSLGPSGRVELTIGYILVLEIQWGMVLMCVIGFAMRNHNPLEVVLERGVPVHLGRNAFYGILALVAMLVVDVLVAVILPWGRHRSQGRIPQTASEVLLLAAIAISAGITEEFIFRGYLLRQFSALPGGQAMPVVLQAIVFAAAHGYAQSPAGVVQKFVFAVLMAWLTRRQRSLTAAIICHSLNDFLLMMGAVFLLR